MLPDERDKLIDELKENWSELKSFLDDDKKPASTEDNEFNDDVFEDDVFIDEDPHSPRHTDPDNRWHMIIEIIERMKYLDMFVKGFSLFLLRFTGIRDYSCISRGAENVSNSQLNGVA